MPSSHICHLRIYGNLNPIFEDDRMTIHLKNDISETEIESVQNIGLMTLLAFFDFYFLVNMLYIICWDK